MTRRAEITRSVLEASSVQIGRQFIKSMPDWLRSKMLEQLENFQSFRENLRRNSNFAQGNRGNSESTSAVTIEASEVIGQVLNDRSGKFSPLSQALLERHLTMYSGQFKSCTGLVFSIDRLEDKCNIVLTSYPAKLMRIEFLFQP